VLALLYWGQLQEPGGQVERSEGPQVEKHARDHWLLLSLVIGVLAAYAIAGFGIYALIQAVA
jgi:hypothetical protein